MGLVVSWVAGELDCLVGGLVLVEHLVGWFVSGSIGFWFSDSVIWWGGESLGLLNGRQQFS